MKDWFLNNLTWLSPLLVAFIGGVYACIAAWIGREKGEKNEINNAANQSVVVNVNPPGVVSSSVLNTDNVHKKLSVLFIDDDDKFKVVKILKNAGWTHVKLVKDVMSIQDANIVASDVIFVDIVGVGVRLGFKNQGIGLAAAIKNHYKNKKVVVYSAESKHNIFDSDLRIVDDTLQKTAEPIEFISLLEEYANI